MKISTNYTNYTNWIEKILTLSHKVIGCAMKVHTGLGCGFLESVYQSAMIREFQLSGIQARSQVPISVDYKGQLVGRYFADFIVANKLLLELKAQDRLVHQHFAQVLNYLNVSDLKIGLLFNFGAESLQTKRVIRGFGPETRI
ncbi:MAG: GxxExxY protein [Xanthomonadales bacterium]|nr:GxxExxY protein [Gammaproteobacteria bacterium]NNE05138.1 GxxExxY protein [Xanthomonadales bacterium]NNL95443.1 GxxExxY protein [Xanthomonadales bacterium]